MYWPPALRQYFFLSGMGEPLNCESGRAGESVGCQVELPEIYTGSPSMSVLQGKKGCGGAGGGGCSRSPLEPGFPGVGVLPRQPRGCVSSARCTGQAPNFSVVTGVWNAQPCFCTLFTWVSQICKTDLLSNKNANVGQVCEEENQSVRQWPMYWKLWLANS